MTALTFGSIEMPSARLGLENPLPPMHPPASVIDGMRIDDSVDAADRTYLGYGLDTGCLPYGLQDQYARGLEPSCFRTAVLENEYLKAVFLIDFGGRLWSLFDKSRQRELLYVNPVFRPGNLAIRNAWFSGGIEWNPSLRGHSPFTCAPLFVAAHCTGEGVPVLRMYEWERHRGVPFQLDFYLPENSAFLFVSIRLFNPHSNTIPMYWWSNVAVSEDPDGRVLVPASGAYRFSYREGRKCMDAISLSGEGGADVTYAVRSPAAADFFFRIDTPYLPWMAALDREGYGLLQVSTPELPGRKLFVWGMGRGGRRWQEFLSTPGHPYIEIQAGLARTQMECLPMPPRAAWHWVEAYGPLQADPVRVHGSDWDAAWRYTEDCARNAIPGETLAGVRQVLDRSGVRPAAELVQRGAGWGALERRRRETVGEEPIPCGGMVFDDSSLTEAQAPWLDLLRHGDLHCPPPDLPPAAWMIQSEWRRCMEQAVQARCAENWLAWLHLGLMRYAADDRAGARRAWETSLDLEASAWACRNLAVLAEDEARTDEAVALLDAACRLRPRCLPLVVEEVRLLARSERYAACAARIDGLPRAMRHDARIRVVRAQAALELGDLEAVEQLLHSGIEVPSVREGEIVLTDLWFELQARRLAATGAGGPPDPALRERVRRECPPPPEIDFRMFEA